MDQTNGLEQYLEYRLTRKGKQSRLKSHAPIDGDFGLEAVIWIKVGINQCQGSLFPVSRVDVN